MGNRESVALAFLHDGHASAVPENTPEHTKTANVKPVNQNRRDIIKTLTSSDGIKPPPAIGTTSHILSPRSPKRKPKWET